MHMFPLEMLLSCRHYNNISYAPLSLNEERAWNTPSSCTFTCWTRCIDWSNSE
uniref:Uncharacterized protein n=1 Tax=Oryza brachyantha TaxID=4533 RepID=J3LKG9_ORYBR